MKPIKLAFFRFSLSALLLILILVLIFSISEMEGLRAGKAIKHNVSNQKVIKSYVIS